MSIHISRNSLTENDIKILEKNYILQKKKKFLSQRRKQRIMRFQTKN